MVQVIVSKHTVGDLQENKTTGKKEKKEKPAKEPPKKKDAEARIDMLDLRIGKIVDVKTHPNADSLYLEMIDVGEDAPRQVCTRINWLMHLIPSSVNLL